MFCKLADITNSGVVKQILHCKEDSLVGMKARFLPSTLSSRRQKHTEQLKTLTMTLHVVTKHALYDLREQIIQFTLTRHFGRIRVGIL